MHYESRVSEIVDFSLELRRKSGGLIEVHTMLRSIDGVDCQDCSPGLKSLPPEDSEQTCPPNWIENENRCYFISSLEKPYNGAREHCSNLDARLLEINSPEEEDFVSISIVTRFRTYWIGKCRDGTVSPDLLYKMFFKWHTCRECNLHSQSYSCNSTYRFICKKSARLYQDIPEEIKGGRPELNTALQAGSHRRHVQLQRDVSTLQ
ncbi:natural killer cells antigen CD94-like [Hypanus sabinus]|uniref:natural killer cells antigen CD94-like n=1 Tax=Hypanus sabinus TaxID=79690 RepID=UPI0028C4F16B|nr:natural killer cells antigen CD94-like [Hypanus sabinus]